jgi:hypothetical protein
MVIIVDYTRQRFVRFVVDFKLVKIRKNFCGFYVGGIQILFPQVNQFDTQARRAGIVVVFLLKYRGTQSES